MRECAIAETRGQQPFAVSQAQIAIAAGCQANTARSHLDWLERAGWLERPFKAKPGERNASTYLVRVPRGGDIVEAHSQRYTRASTMSPGNFLRLTGSRNFALSEGSGERISRGPEGARNAQDIDVSLDPYRFRSTGHLWAVVAHLSPDSATTLLDLVERTGKSPRQIRRYVERLHRHGLIPDRRDLRLVPDWEQRLEKIAAARGTLGQKARAEADLAETRLHRRRVRLVRKGQATWLPGPPLRAVEVATGEII